MTCNEFRERIGERLVGELATEQEREFDLHLHTCASCRKELNEWQQLETWLRDGWPSEDAPPLGFLLPRQARRTWFELASVWFARASTALVVVCLLGLVLLRPTIQWEQTGLRLAFGSAVLKTEPESGKPMTAEQVQTWVQAAVKQAMAQELARTQSLLSASDRGPEDVRRWSQVAIQIKMLEQRQAFLWQQVQEQGLNLQSLWRTSFERIEPARDTQLRRQ